LCASGKYILFVDADGATKFSDLDCLERELNKIISKEGYGVAVGSRAHLVKTEAVVKVKKHITLFFHIQQLYPNTIYFLYRDRLLEIF